LIFPTVGGEHHPVCPGTLGHVGLFGNHQGGGRAGKGGAEGAWGFVRDWVFFIGGPGKDGGGGGGGRPWWGVVVKITHGGGYWGALVRPQNGRKTHIFGGPKRPPHVAFNQGGGQKNASATKKKPGVPFPTVQRGGAGGQKKHRGVKPHFGGQKPRARRCSGRRCTNTRFSFRGGGGKTPGGVWREGIRNKGGGGGRHLPRGVEPHPAGGGAGRARGAGSWGTGQGPGPTRVPKNNRGQGVRMGGGRGGRVLFHPGPVFQFGFVGGPGGGGSGL